jgi:epoxyqueuosine reductase QueG
MERSCLGELIVKASRRKELEKIALERLMANGDDPYDYLWGEGADILGKWCPWSKYDTEIFTGQIEGLDLPWSKERTREIENGAALKKTELAQWRRAMCHWWVEHQPDDGLMAWIMPVRKESGIIEAYAAWLDQIGNPAPTADGLYLFGIFNNADEAKAKLTAKGALNNRDRIRKEGRR